MSSIEVDTLYPHPPAKVWRAITDPVLLAQWLMPNDFQPRLGHRFTFTTDPAPGFDGIVHCEVLDVQPERLLSISWRGGPPGLDSTVTWQLTPEGDGTRLFFTHSGFDDTQSAHRSVRDTLDGGWRNHMPPRLLTVLGDLPTSQ